MRSRRKQAKHDSSAPRRRPPTGRFFISKWTSTSEEIAPGEAVEELVPVVIAAVGVLVVVAAVGGGLGGGVLGLVPGTLGVVR